MLTGHALAILKIASKLHERMFAAPLLVFHRLSSSPSLLFPPPYVSVGTGGLGRYHREWVT